MDPSSGRDRDSNSSSSEPENPFIKFKNFADSQVSSLLQGIIGLPSAISRRSSEHNRWADIDEDLRRRDQLQARQKLLEEQWREAEAVKAGGNSVMTAGEIPAKTSQPYQASQTSGSDSRWERLVNGQESLNGETKGNSKTIQDLPLYSPVTKDLFENFDPKEAISGAFPLPGLGRFAWHGFGVPPSTSDSTGMVKILALTTLKVSPILHSEYSLLPYLLFSPYSPIKLESEAEMSINRRNDKFRYCAAFEDLIRISQGRESPVHSYHASERLSNSLFFNLPNQNHWFWMLFLHHDGILQQKRQDSASAPDLKAWRAIGSFPQGSDLDMFEQVQNFPKLPSTFAATVSSLDDAFTQDPHTTEEKMEVLRREQLNAARELFIQQHDLHTKGMTKEDAERISAASRAMKHAERAPAEEKKVVSTNTSTERFTHEDGTVETSITIWKQFDDGSTTTVTTSHTEEAAWDDSEQSSWPDPRAPKKEKKDPEKEKKEKKGWFWN